MSSVVVHVTGARPNFPKAAPVLAALDKRGVEQVLVHTGQHYDERMSDALFDDLGLRPPDVNLGVGSGTHARQTAAVMLGLEDLFLQRRPELVVVYGDVNSTLAASLVASKLRIPVAHVEAGLRSFDLDMPEEINRLVTDRLSDVLLATSSDAVEHLLHEGVAADRIHLVGNPMIDSLVRNLPRLDAESVRQQWDLPEVFVLATLHRPGNVDHPAAVADLVTAMREVQERLPVVLPLHPRGRANLEAAGLLALPGVHCLPPLGYLDFLSLLTGAAAVITDSGGVQEESTVLGVPCLTLRPNTERPVTITHGTNQLVTPQSLLGHLEEVLAVGRPSSWPTPPLWDGHAAERIADVLVAVLSRQAAAGGTRT